MDKTPVNAHQDEPRTLGGRLPRIVADVLSHDRAFLDALAQQGPRSIEGTVTATQRDSSGANRVQIKRTGQAASEAAWYTVWNPMHVPIAGDVLRLLIVGRGAAIILGAKHGGRPNEHTIAYAGGAHHHYDSARNHIHKHGDDHHHRHYRTDGATIAHHNHEAGHHAHIGNHRMGGGGGMGLADDGTPSGVWHEKAHNNGRYEHSQSGTLVRHHSTGGDHGHYAGGVLIHNIIGVGTSGGAVKLRQSGAAFFHQHGDDGSGKYYAQHASGHRVHDHDGTTLQQYVLANLAHRATVGAVGTGAYSHHFYHSASASGDTELAVLDPAGTTAGTAGGRLRFKQFAGTGGAGGATPHIVGDDGAGNCHALSQSGTHKILISNGAGLHTHTAGTHTYPTGAYHNAPATDSSRLDSIGAGGAGGIKKASHSTTSGTQDYSWTMSSSGGQGPSLGGTGAYTDPHFKFTAANVWSASNVGLYRHPTPSPISFGGSLNSAVIGWGYPVSTGAGTWDWNSAWHCDSMSANAINELSGKSTSGAAVTGSFLWLVVNT